MWTSSNKHCNLDYYLLTFHRWHSGTKRFVTILQLCSYRQHQIWVTRHAPFLEQPHPIFTCTICIASLSLSSTVHYSMCHLSLLRPDATLAKSLFVKNILLQYTLRSRKWWDEWHRIRLDKCENSKVFSNFVTSGVLNEYRFWKVEY